MQRHLDAGNERLPLVVPLLFYHGQVTPYPYSLRWLDEFGDPELAIELYVGAFPLVDVTVIPDDKSCNTGVWLSWSCYRNISSARDLAELLEQRVTLLLARYTTQEQLALLMHYMLQVGDTAAPDTFIRELARRASQHEEVPMTVAQKLELKGIEKGCQEGKLAVARLMLANGLDQNLVIKMTGLTADDLAKIRHYHH
ncbi:MAG: Rpn family recombination-promoting nuclease/putative transposase [Serratia symbiotica]|nr:Rpn family recombination-promoting nuclease/putative transposase [Serratia symbiotica]